MRPIVSILLLCVITVAASRATLASENPLTTRPAASVKVVLVGDSTVTEKVGWGSGFKASLNDDVECVDFARGGRSSKSYRNEGWWDQALAEKGDYVLIQFGHNDQPGKGPDRETDPNTEFRANLTRYVNEARANGSKPILVTSLTRRNFNPDGTLRRSLDAYVNVTREVAVETTTPLIDLHARSVALVERLGPAGCEPLSPRDKDGKIDATHLNAKGSSVFGGLVAEELVLVEPELKSRVKAAKR